MKVKGLKATLGAKLLQLLLLISMTFSINAFPFASEEMSSKFPPVKYIPVIEKTDEESKRDLAEHAAREKETNKRKSIIRAIKRDYKKSETEASWWADNIIKAAAMHSNVSERELMAIIATESSFRKNPPGRANIGPMQVNKRVWEGKTKYSLFKPESNILLGAKIFSDYKRGCNGNIECAFKTYNVGPTAYKKGKSYTAQKNYYGKAWNNYKKFYSLT